MYFRTTVSVLCALLACVGALPSHDIEARGITKLIGYFKNDKECNKPSKNAKYKTSYFSRRHGHQAIRDFCDIIHKSTSDSYTHKFYPNEPNHLEMTFSREGPDKTLETADCENELLPLLDDCKSMGHDQLKDTTWKNKFKAGGSLHLQTKDKKTKRTYKMEPSPQWSMKDGTTLGPAGVRNEAGKIWADCTVEEVSSRSDVFKIFGYGWETESPEGAYTGELERRAPFKPNTVRECFENFVAGPDDSIVGEPLVWDFVYQKGAGGFPQAEWSLTAEIDYGKKCGGDTWELVQDCINNIDPVYRDYNKRQDWRLECKRNTIAGR